MRQRGDVYGLINTLRTGLVRNLGNITSARLFNHSFFGTKVLIEEYIAQYVEGVLDLAALPPPVDGEETALPLPQEWEDGEISGGNGGVEDEVSECWDDTGAGARKRRCRSRKHHPFPRGSKKIQRQKKQSLPCFSP